MFSVLLTPASTKGPLVIGAITVKDLTFTQYFDQWGNRYAAPSQFRLKNPEITAEFAAWHTREIHHNNDADTNTPHEHDMFEEMTPENLAYYVEHLVPSQSAKKNISCHC